MGKENTGYIIKLPNGKFKAILEYPPVDGRRTKKTRTCSTEAKAKKALIDLNLERKTATTIKKQAKLPFKEAVSVYKENIAKRVKVGLLKKKTHLSYTQIADKLLDKFLLYDTHKITKDDIDNYIDHLLYKQELAPSSVSKVKIVFNAILAANKIEPLRVKKIPGSHKRVLDRIQPLSKREQLSINDYIKTNLSKHKGKKNKAWIIIYLYYFGLLTGCRLGEIAGLRWSSVREDEGVIIIDNNLIYIPGEGLLNDTPKTFSSSGRRLVVSKKTFKLLKELKGIYKDNEYGESEYVFITRKGNPLSPRNILRDFQSLCEKAGVTNHHTFHDLRHTNITTKIGRGVDVKTVSLMAGHADTLITLNTYAHFWKEAAQRASNMFDYDDDWQLPD